MCKSIDAAVTFLYKKQSKTKMETIQVSIPTMKSSHCMTVVSNSLKTVAGAALKKVRPGEAEIELTGTTQEAVVAAIEHAGYTIANK